MALSGTELIRSFMALKSFQMQVREDNLKMAEYRKTQSRGGGVSREGGMVTKEDYNRQMRRQARESTSQAPMVAGTGPGIYESARASKMMQEGYSGKLPDRVQQRQALENKGYMWMSDPHGGHGSWITGTKVEHSSMERLNDMEAAEEKQNRFPREVLAAQEGRAEAEMNLAKRMGTLAAEERDMNYYRDRSAMSDSMSSDRYPAMSEFIRKWSPEGLSRDELRGMGR